MNTALVAAILVATCALPLAAQDTTACPLVEPTVKGSTKPHSYLIGRYDAVADTTHLEGGGTDPRIHIDLRLDFHGADSAAPQLGILDILLGDPWVEAARTAPDSARIALLIDDSVKVRAYSSGRMYRRMDPYPITLQGALSPRGFTALLSASKVAVLYAADTVPVPPEVMEGLKRLSTALTCAPRGIPQSR